MKTLKTIAITAVCALAFISCKKENAADKITTENIEAAATRDASANKFPVMTWEQKEYDFGNIKQGEVVETRFNFTNTGDKPLVIVNIKGSCGCTVPADWPRQPIMPGKTGSFGVKFDSKGKKNQNNKTVTVTANTETGKETVQIKVFVEAPAAGTVAPKATPTLITK